MISSAVVIPEQPLQPESPASSPTLKRRQSSTTSETNKRPRLDSNTNGAYSPPTSQMSPPSRRSISGATVNVQEEKKRGQRLFGALLGTLSQSNSRPAHKKRDEIERRQQDKLRKDAEERKEEVRRRREGIDRVREVEQKAWNGESTRIRHQNMRSMARFLKTRIEPPLYYKPWELRDEEERQIEQQLEEVERVIRSEMQSTLNSDTKSAEDEKKISPDTLHDSLAEKTEDDHNQAEPDPVHEDEVKQEPPQEAEKHNREQEIKLPSDDDRPKDDDHGEELVEGQEDDVIY